MSRVTKLQKQNRARYKAREDRRFRGFAKSRRVRAAQLQRPHRCICGHYDHGEYGCYQGCAWALCQAELHWTPIRAPHILIGDFHVGDDLAVLWKDLLRENAQVPYNVILLGDMMAGSLDKPSRM